MTSPTRVVALLLVISWGIPIPAQAASRPGRELSPAEKRLLEAGGKGFELYTTEHFWIAYNTSAARVYRLGARAEGVYRAAENFCRHKEIAFRPPNEPLRVLYFDEPKEFHRYAQRVKFQSSGTYGFYLDSNGRSAFYNLATDPALRRLQKRIEAARKNLRQAEEFMETIRHGNQQVEIQYDDGRTEVISAAKAAKQIRQTRRELNRLERREQAYRNYLNKAVIQHEIAHQILFQSGVHNRQARNPQWVVEGLATLFESSLGRLLYGRPSISYIRLDDFRNAIGGDDHLEKKLRYKDFAEAVKNGDMIALERLLTKPDLFKKRGKDGANAYALAWALMYYLQRHHEDQLTDYLRAIQQRPPGKEPEQDEELALFEQHFGPVDEEFKRKFCRFLFRLRPIRLQG